MYSSCEALGQHGQVELDGGDLPVPSEDILDVDVDLRAVEGAVARIHLVGQAVGLECLVERALGGIPLVLRPQVARRARGQLERRRKVEQLVKGADQPEHAGDLVLHLVGTAVDMGVVHGDLPHAKQPGQRARALVSVQPADLGDTQRQVPVRAQRVAVHVRRLRAVHRLQAERLLLDVELEHVVAVVLPVPGLLPQLLVHQDRRRGLEIAVRVVRPRARTPRAGGRSPSRSAARTGRPGRRRGTRTGRARGRAFGDRASWLPRGARGTCRGPPGRATRCRRCAAASGSARLRASRRRTTTGA